MAAEIRENKCVVLKNRPGVESQPNDSNFALEKREVPPCNEGEILVKTLYLSVDPYMRCRMNEETGSSYLTPWPLGDPPTGGGVGQVIQSKSQNFKEGDIVESIMWPWQELVVFSGENPRLVKVFVFVFYFLLHPIGESLFTLFASLTYAYHYLMTLIK